MIEPKYKTKSFKHDMLRVGQPYTININPDNAHQYNIGKFPIGDRLFNVCRYVQNVSLRKIRKHTTYFLCPEISSPKEDNMKGITRYHFHGIITFNDYIGIKLWYSHVLNDLKDKAMIEIDTIDNIETRTNYCYKNQETMSMLCEGDNTPYPITNITGMMTTPDGYLT